MFGENPLEERSAHRRHLYLTTHHSQQTDMHALMGLESANPAGEPLQTYALDRAATDFVLTPD